MAPTYIYCCNMYWTACFWHKYWIC